MPLDARKALHGEPRLSDPAVRALRDAAAGGLIEGWNRFIGRYEHLPKTIHGRTLQHLLDQTADGVIVASASGRKVLADIDKAAASGEGQSDE